MEHFAYIVSSFTCRCVDLMFCILSSFKISIWSVYEQNFNEDIDLYYKREITQLILAKDVKVYCNIGTSQQQQQLLLP